MLKRNLLEGCYLTGFCSLRFETREERLPVVFNWLASAFELGFQGRVTLVPGQSTETSVTLFICSELGPRACYSLRFYFGISYGSAETV